MTIEIEEHGATKVAEIIDEQFSSQEFERILQTINTSSRKMKNKEYAGGIITSIFLGAQAGLKEAGKHVKVA